jgi:hypothetical protein
MIRDPHNDNDCYGYKLIESQEWMGMLQMMQKD